MHKQHTQGVAIISVLLLIALLMGVFVVMAQLTISNVNQTGDSIAAARTYAAAQGGRNFGQLTLQGSVSARLRDAIDAQATGGALGNAGKWVFAPGTTTAVPPSATVSANLAVLSAEAQARLPGQGCYGPFTTAGTQQLSLRVSLTGTFPACDGQPAQAVSLGSGRYLSGSVDSTQEYSLPYAMVISAAEGSARRSVSVSGEIRFTVGNSSFARFALLTDNHQNSTTSSIVFTSNTLFNGPVHTNGNFSFIDKPWFGGNVTSAGITDRKQKGGYFRGEEVVTSWWGSKSIRTVTEFRTASQLGIVNPSWGTTTPEFKGGVSWNATEIPFPENSNNQKSAAQTSGLYIAPPGTGKTNSVLLSVGLGETGTPFPGVKVQEMTVGTTRYRVPEIVTPSPSGNASDESRLPGPLYMLNSQNKWVIVKNTAGKEINPFNGVIYADGGLESFSGPARTNANDYTTAPPAVASFIQMSLVSNKDVRVTGDLKYEVNPCSGALERKSDGSVNVPKCENDPNKVRNVLGMYASDGADIKIGLGNTTKPWLNVPADVRIHATMMADGEVTVENYDNTVAPGTPAGGCSLVYILGGVIERTYGPFGKVGANSSCSSGFGRSFTYDQRMLQGLTPPMFPTTTITQLMGSSTVLQYAQTEQTTR